jgi:hypothetical protein
MRILYVSCYFGSVVKPLSNLVFQPPEVKFNILLQESFGFLLVLLPFFFIWSVEILEDIKHQQGVENVFNIFLRLISYTLLNLLDDRIPDRNVVITQIEDNSRMDLFGPTSIIFLYLEYLANCWD